METVHITCSECQKVLAVRREDLGHHVHCPLCQTVVLAQVPESAPEPPVESPPATDIAPAATAGADFTTTTTEVVAESSGPAEEVTPPLEMTFSSPATESESIFGSSDTESEDIFGGSSAPKTILPIEEAPTEIQTALNLGREEVPPESPAPQPPANEPTEELPPHPSAPEPMDAPGVVFHDAGAEELPSGFEADAQRSWMEDERVPPAHGAAQPAGVSVAGSEAVRRTRASGMIATILLIFFIPYSVFTTAVIAWLVVTRETYNMDPLERMLEDNRGGKKKGIERIKHDAEVPDKLRTTLNQPLRIGAVEIVPLKVTLKDGDLALYMKLRNISKDLKFNPLPAEFAEYNRKAQGRNTPYIFLQRDVDGGDAPAQRPYGGEVLWFGGPEGNQRRLNAELMPDESMTAVLITLKEDRNRVQSLLKSKSPFLWRVHLRRGLEKIAGADRVITCVVGVEFQLEDIEKS